MTKAAKKRAAMASSAMTSGSVQPALRRLQHAVGQRCQRDREGAGARPVEAGRIGIARFLDGAQAEQRGCNRKRCDQKEDRPPAEGIDEQAGGDRAKGEADAETGAEEGEGAQPQLSLEFLGKRGGAAGEGGRAAEPLRGPQRVEPDDVRREHRAQRGQDIEAEAGKEDAACGHDCRRARPAPSGWRRRSA